MSDNAMKSLVFVGMYDDKDYGMIPIYRNPTMEEREAREQWDALKGDNEIDQDTNILREPEGEGGADRSGEDSCGRGRDQRTGELRTVPAHLHNGKSAEGP